NERIVRLRDVSGGYLVLSEVYYPGWRATVDGRPAPVIRANNLFQAVPLPDGAREVRLTFRPTGWTTAVALSAVGWLLAGAGAARAITRGQPPPLVEDRRLWN